MKERDVIAVDGPGAAGKSVCAEVAKRLGYALLDSGAIYRTLTLLVLRSQIDPHDVESVARLIKCNLGCISFWNNQLIFSGQPVRDEIRTPQISALVHHIAKIPAVRKLVVPLQRSFGAEDRLDIIAEGRDIGSVIFPEARVKIFMTADPSIRALRRFDQYREKDPAYAGTLDQVRNELRARDMEDTTRPESPLIRLPEAVFIDSTFMTKQEVLDKMLQVCYMRVAV
ncbi:MAG: (d)CMP kinase [Candidatus Pacebacteria bacterium]|nr:(d)CMP kinase [Candidatus Paceibacterota bacterium]